MSGPKTSRYTLTAEQRRILAEQRRNERRKAVATEKLRKFSKRLLEIGGGFTSEQKISSELHSRTGTDGGFGEKYDTLQRIITANSGIISEVDMNDPDMLENTVSLVGADLTKAEELANELGIISEANSVALRTQLNTAIDRGFDTSFADIRIETELDSQKRELRQQLENYIQNDTLPEVYINDVSDVLNRIESISDLGYLKNFASLSVQPLMKNCNKFLSEHEQYHETFDELYTEYTALCDLYGYVKQEYFCSAESVDILKTEIQRIQEAMAEDDEQSYISDCVDEVMEEMGYSVLGSREVTKKNGKRFRNELYEYGEGTAVNVTYSSDGRIAMELGGTDTADRLPDAGETAVLCDAMESFCDDFREIEKRLAAKGVVLSERISLLPPEAEYAQIINTSDYKLEQQAENFRVERHRHSVKENKTMKLE